MDQEAKSKENGEKNDFLNMEFVRSRHQRFFKLHLDLMPAKSASLDSMRVTMLYFAISGLDIIGSLDNVLVSDQRQHAVSWIYRLQIVPNETKSNVDCCGFQGSTCLNFEPSLSTTMCLYRQGNVAYTYSALCTLLVLGDDLSRVNKKALTHGIRALQEPSGSFKCTLADGDSDMRFVFCACAVSYILNDWSGLDRDLCQQFILNSFNYDCGFGQGPNLESHGGSTYCALASLSLMDSLSLLTEKQIKGLKRWLIFRQRSSFQGRPNKPVDTCYTFWIGASLKILGISSWIDETALLDRVMQTQQESSGGFSKWPDTRSDLMHTYLGIAGLSLLKTHSFQLEGINPSLNISNRAHRHLKTLHATWRDQNEL